MKSAIYLDEGNTQLVLTPENEWEKNILRMVNAAYPGTFYGGFYACQGGWYRHYSSDSEKDSLIFRLKQKAEIPEPGQ